MGTRGRERMREGGSLAQFLVFPLEPHHFYPSRDRFPLFNSLFSSKTKSILIRADISFLLDNLFYLGTFSPTIPAWKDSRESKRLSLSVDAGPVAGGTVSEGRRRMMTPSYIRYTSTSLSVFTKLQWNNNCNVFNVCVFLQVVLSSVQVFYCLTGI